MSEVPLFPTGTVLVIPGVDGDLGLERRGGCYAVGVRVGSSPKQLLYTVCRVSEGEVSADTRVENAVSRRRR